MTMFYQIGRIRAILKDWNEIQYLLEIYSWSYLRPTKFTLAADSLFNTMCIHQGT